jgi:hypothetical protein
VQGKLISKYYIVRIIAGLLFMGSFGGGFLACAEYGKPVGWISFIALAAAGIILHKIADKIRESS